MDAKTKMIMKIESFLSQRERNLFYLSYPSGELVVTDKELREIMKEIIDVEDEEEYWMNYDHRDEIDIEYGEEDFYPYDPYKDMWYDPFE